MLNSLWSSIIWSLKDGIECQIIKYIANPAIRDAILKITNKRAIKIISSKKLKEINFLWYIKNDNIIVDKLKNRKNETKPSKFYMKLNLLKKITGWKPQNNVNKNIKTNIKLSKLQ